MTNHDGENDRPIFWMSVQYACEAKKTAEFLEYHASETRDSSVRFLLLKEAHKESLRARTHIAEAFPELRREKKELDDAFTRSLERAPSPEDDDIRELRLRHMLKVEKCLRWHCPVDL